MPEGGRELSWFVPTVSGMDIDWSKELLDQLGFQWDGILRPRLAGLTDEQLHWEPAPGTWGVRRRAEAVTNMAAGAGDTVIDFALPEPTPPPLTTVAWRLGHIAMVLGQRAANHFGAGDLDYPTVDWPLGARDMLAFVDAQHDRWIEGVRSLGPEGLGRPCGPSEGPYADAPMAALVLHINREVLHHGAEVALMLDLHEHLHEHLHDAAPRPGGRSS
jgi:DinB superfamily